jgi:hypothetical protein
MNPCEQTDNIKHLQGDLANHQVWRRETTKQLTNIEIQLGTVDERLKNKLASFDEHVRDGNAFRTTLIFTVIGLLVSIASGLIAYGKLEAKVDHAYSVILGK